MSRPSIGPLAPSIAAITLGVRDVQRSVAFYRALGLEPDVRTDARSALFQLNGLLLQLVRRGIIDPEMGAGHPGEGLVALRHDARSEADIDAILVEVSRAGGRVLRAPESGPWLGRRAWFADPDGHRWELSFDPSLRRDEHGGVWLPPREVLEPFGGDVQPLLEEDTEDLGHALETAEEPISGMRPMAAMVEFDEEERPTEVFRDPVSTPSAPRRPPAPTPRPRPMSAKRPTKARPRPVPRSSRSRSRSSAPFKAPERSSEQAPRGWTMRRLIGLGLVILAPLAGGAVAWGLIRFVLP